jgi:LPS sulfotransferase NodH
MSATFVVGPPRSGTTLLMDLLAAHPGLTVHGKDFHRFHHDLTRLRERTERTDHFRLTTADAAPTLAAEYRAAIAQAQAEAVTEHFVLKISTLSIQIDYVKALVPEARFIQLVRDGRDAACSMEDLRQALQGRDAERALGPAPDPLGLWCAEHFESGHVRAAASWAYHVARSWLDLRFAGPDAFCRVRYEDLVARPAAVLADVMAFIGLPVDPRQEALLAEVRDVPGKPHGLGFSTTQAKGPRRIGRFEQELSSAERVVISPLFDLPMRLLGYTPDPWPEALPFFAACRELGIAPELWRDRAKAEAAFFARHHGAFLPERMLRRAPVITSHDRPLLVDAAHVGHSVASVDAAPTAAQSFVQKQDRRHVFADPEGAWPRLAMGLNGEATIGELRDRGLLNDDSLALLSRLSDLGFVAWL